MTIAVPHTPFFLPPHKGENNGVDFLGLRQTNLDMMGELIPSTNNVTAYIRPFSLLAWTFWKFHALCAKAGLHEPSRDDVTQFRERIEILFTWGARLDTTAGGIPGTTAAPPAVDAQGRVPLTFSAWGRIPSSTSLIAALWYGPASKTVTGLGFLDPLPGRSEFFRATGLGVQLATALDEQLRLQETCYRRLLDTLDPVLASEEDAKLLWRAWSPENLTEPERAAFAAALYSDEQVGNTSTLRGKRSTTLALVLHHLKCCEAPASAPEIRMGMALSATASGVYTVPETLLATRNNWLTLQMRQLQRLSMESLLSWSEAQILGHRVRETTEMASNFDRHWDPTQYGLLAGSLAELISVLDQEAISVEGFIAAVRAGTLPNPFDVMSSIHSTIRAGSDQFTNEAFLGLLLCASFAAATDAAGSLLAMTQLGGSPRVSMANLRKRLVGLGDVSVREAFEFVLETLIISQHMATAVNRFEGQNQRLRLTLEEGGLDALVGKPWEPTVTEDRLPTLLSLAAQSRLLMPTGDHRYAAVQA
jgi:hypothetical protein